MSENEQTTVPDDFDLMEWIESGTVARRKVTIYNNPALVEEYEALEAELAAAEKAIEESGGDAPMDSADPREGIVARMEALYERWEASKATWTVRALSREDVDACFEAVPAPKMPVPPMDKAGQKAQDRFAEKVAEYTKAKAETDDERKLHMIAAAVVGVETPRGNVESVTVEQVRALRDRPHGQQWVDRLYAAVEAATEGDVQIPRPTLPGRSTSDLG